MDINEATAKALQAARAVSGMTYEEIAEKSGVSAPTVYRMFGAKRDIKVPQLYAVAKVMGITLVEVMQDAERIRSRDERNQSLHQDSVVNDIHDLASHPEMYDLAADTDPNKDAERDVEDYGA